jgi:hypothetical protein
MLNGCWLGEVQWNEVPTAQAGLGASIVASSLAENTLELAVADTLNCVHPIAFEVVVV